MASRRIGSWAEGDDEAGLVAARDVDDSKKPTSRIERCTLCVVEAVSSRRSECRRDEMAASAADERAWNGRARCDEADGTASAR